MKKDGENLPVAKCAGSWVYYGDCLQGNPCEQLACPPGVTPGITVLLLFLIVIALKTFLGIKR